MQSVTFREVGLVSDIGGQGWQDTTPFIGEEHLLTVGQQLPDPFPHAGRIGQDSFGERCLQWSSRRGPVQCGPAGRGRGEQGRCGADGYGATTRGDQRRIDPPLITEVVDTVQLLGQGVLRARRKQEVGSRGAPQDIGLGDSLQQLRWKRCCDRRGPGFSTRVVRRFHQDVQDRRQLRKGRCAEGVTIHCQPLHLDRDTHL